MSYIKACKALSMELKSIDAFTVSYEKVTSEESFILSFLKCYKQNRKEGTETPFEMSLRVSRGENNNLSNNTLGRQWSLKMIY